MKRKFLCFMLTMSMVISISGCSANTASTANTETTTEVKEENKDSIESTNNTEDETSKENEDDSSEITEVASSNNEEVAQEVISLRDVVPNVLDSRIGCAVTQSELEDPKVWDIVTTHFNAVTFGNELKPDALVDYSCDTCPGTEEVDLNGETIVVPKLSFKRAESMLDKIYDWNQENPDRKIMVRGHVLVWHSQTPEWFFHEDYDKKNDYVDKDTMNKRLEWYIREVLTHFTGEDSKYKDMFYGWDVVNEAINDRDGGLRTDNENPNEKLSESRHGSNSSWYHIYQDNEFIINAFIYANKYAPDSLELYYNDYNECNTLKRNGIAELLTAIKEKEGEKGVGTRISAMGMQGHYGMDNPGFTEIEYAAKLYAEIVGSVQITELDISASDSYDRTEESKIQENEKLKKRYNIIYFTLKSLKNNSNVNIGGVTFWGTVDHYSWLQSKSNIGGGNKTGLPQMPLLFDENYEPKPCFFVFTEQ